MGLVVPAGFLSSFGFDPLTLGPSLWLSNTGSDAGTWPDLSGNGRNATQGTGSAQPSIVTGINGLQCRRFDGTSDFMNVAAGTLTERQTHTCFSVAQKLSGDSSTFRIFLSLNQGISPSPWHGWYTGTGFRTVSAGLAGAEFSSGTSSGPSIFEHAFQSTPSKSFNGMLDGSNLGTSTVSGIGTPGSFGIFLGQYGTGSLRANVDLGEILIFPRVLTTDERSSVRAYLKSKWGTP